MSPKFSALLVLIILEKAGSSVRPVVTFNPNWDKIFTTESLTMTCNVRSPVPADRSYTWYKDNDRIHSGQSLVIRKEDKADTGNYQCKGTNTELSDPVRLDIIHGWVILQVPLYVHEGDDVTLRCHHYPSYNGGETRFYKNDVLIRNWGSDPELRIKDINPGESHRYKCTKEVRHNGAYYTHDGEASISVKELFTSPEIKVTPFPVTEGDNVTVTCHTSVSPYRPDTGLQFAFYKDGRNVQSLGSSDQYGFQSTQLEYSGRYYCDVKTVSGTKIGKRSKEINIEINMSFTQPEIILIPNQIEEGDPMTLTCHTIHNRLIPDTRLEFAFYRDGQNVQEFSISDRYEVGSAQSKLSGNYSCEMRASTSTLTRSSNELYIRIQELCSQPKIEMIPDVIIEGSPMLLTCNTSVMRNDIELQFAFYKNEENIQQFNSSQQYEVPSARLEDSGNYFCEVRSSIKSAIKRSEILNVDMKGQNYYNSAIMMIRLILSGLLLIITFSFIHYHIKFINSLKLRNKGSTSLRL